MQMTVSMAVGLVLMPAIAFVAAYPALVHRLSRGLVSPYAKAGARKRLTAAFVDSLVVATIAVVSATAGEVLYLVLCGAYLLLRDAIGGQSIGKLVCGLVVIDLQSGLPAAVVSSAKRNSVFLLPGANLTAVFLEGRTILTDPQGQRLGDRLAQTQVVEGAGAPELVRSLQDWLMQVSGVFGQASGRRRPMPDRSDRAA